MNVVTSRPIEAWQLITVAVPAISGLVAVLFGWWLASRREASQRRYSFVERQLRELYSPLLAIRSEIQTLWSVQYDLFNATDEEWRKECERFTGDPVGLNRWAQESRERFNARILYDNQQSRDVIVPAYKRMAGVLKDNLWLAEPDTREHLPKLLKFIELWERAAAKTIPFEVAVTKKIDLSEGQVWPFYENLQKTHDRLQKKLRRVNT